MEKLSNVFRDIIYRNYLHPKFIFENKFDKHFKEYITNKSRIISFLLLVITLTYVLPMFILLDDLSIESKPIYSILYLSICFFSLIGASGFLDAKKMLETKSSNQTRYLLYTFTLEKNIDLNFIAVNLIDNHIFEGSKQDLVKVLSNQIPNFKINNIFKGGSGAVTYHSIFFSLQYVFINDISHLKPKSIEELLRYIQNNFLMDGNQIDLKLLKSGYKTWRNNYYSNALKSFVEKHMS